MANLNRLLSKCPQCGAQFPSPRAICDKCKLIFGTESKTEIANTARKNELKSEIKKNIAVGLALTLLVAAVAFFSSRPPESNSEPRHDSKTAIIMAESFVKDRLKAPSTADFPFDKQEAEFISDNTYEVRGVVDSQNSFGAMIRTEYRCTLQVDGKKWNLLEIHLN